MLRVDRRFTDMDTIMDDLHDLFEWWSDEALDAGALDEYSIEVMKLAIHEWLANLVQHARFPEEEPLIKLTLAPDEQRIHCAIEDNSSGFDLLQQVTCQRHHLEAAPEPPERGRGLLLMIACTENLSYRPVSASAKRSKQESYLHRLEFWVSPRESSIPEALDSIDAADQTPQPHSLSPSIDRPLIARESV